MSPGFDVPQQRERALQNAPFEPWLTVWPDGNAPFPWSDDLVLRFEAVGTVCVPASVVHGARGIRIERPAHHGLPVLFFRGDESVGRLAMFHPIHDY